MGASAYIGRVGRLAVALGVGTAIVTGHGVASAEETGPSTDSSTSSTTSTSTDTAANPSSPSPEAPSAPEPDPSPTTQPATDSTPTTAAPGVVTAQTNTGTSGTTEPTAPTEVPAEAPKEAPKKSKTSTPTAVKKRAAATTTVDAGTEAEQKAATAASQEPATPAADTASAKVSTLAASAAESEEPGPAAAVTRTSAVQDVPAAPANPLKIVTNLVASVIDMVLGPVAGTGPTSPAEPPMAWALLAFARREIENFVSGVTGTRTGSPTAATQTTSLSLAAAAAVAQLSPSTQFISWVTGDHQTANPLIADTLTRFGVSGTDVGTMWDNGMVDDPTTPYDEHQVLIAFGDTFGLRSVPGEDWRFNVLARSADHDLSDGMDIPDGEFGNGNWYGGMPLWDVPPNRPYENYARRIINPEDLPAGLPKGVTLIPTAGISLQTPGTKYGVTQYVSFMSVKQWGAAGQWTTNYSAIAYSEDNGENWKIAPTSVRRNDPYTGNSKFQQAAFVRTGDGYVYSYGTPNGRQGSAYLSRVLEKDILDVTKYEYYSKGTSGWAGTTPAGWYKNKPSAATVVFGTDKGACGVGNPGNQVSEFSVQYNKQLNKYVTLYGDQYNNIVMRTSDTPQGTWSSAKVLLPQQPGGIYAPMMHPWSPSTLGTGTDLYWNLSQWNDYNVMLMKTDLTKV